MIASLLRLLTALLHLDPGDMLTATDGTVPSPQEEAAAAERAAALAAAKAVAAAGSDEGAAEAEALEAEAAAEAAAAAAANAEAKAASKAKTTKESGGEELHWDTRKVVECSFIKALVWSVGAAIDGRSRALFDDYLRALCTGHFAPKRATGKQQQQQQQQQQEEEGGEFDDAEEEALIDAAHSDFLAKNRDYDSATFAARTAALLPPRVEQEAAEGGGAKAPAQHHHVTLFDVRFDPVKAVWIPWIDKDFAFDIPTGASYNSVVVPTVDTIRNEWLMDALLKKAFHVLCTGDTGTGKSVSVKKKLLEGMPKEQFTSMFLNFSAQTSANQTQDIIDSKLDKRRKGVIGPPVGKRCVVMVDDLNMPAKEIYGAQPPIEILRQWMDHSGWYDRDENVYRELVDIQFIAAMGPPGGGRTFITQRYVRHFNVLNFVPFSDPSLVSLFATIMDWFFTGKADPKNKFSAEVQGASRAMISATVSVYNSIAENLLPTPSKSHYLFNLRDISKIFQGVTQARAAIVGDALGLVRLWAHECLRVFCDRLISDDDRHWFESMLGSTTEKAFSGAAGKGKPELTFRSDVLGWEPATAVRTFVQHTHKSILCVGSRIYTVPVVCLCACILQLFGWDDHYLFDASCHPSWHRSVCRA